jgi:hypothetical protein
LNILSLEFLDKIISILEANKNKLTAHEINILFITDDFYSLYRKDFKLDNYLPILIKDAYVKEVEEFSEIEGFGTSNVKYYSLTAEGLKFTGYVNSYYSKMSEEEQRKTMFDNQLSLNKSIISTNRSIISTNFWMKWLTGLIAFGTLVAAIYYLLEILKLCNILCSCNNE